MWRSVVVAMIGVVVVATTSVSPSTRLEAGLAPALFRPEAARTVTKSQLPLLITLYWLRVVNAIGGAESASKNKSLADYGRLITTLDPHFYQPYYYLGVSIPYRYSLRQYRNVNEAAELLAAGCKQFPTDLRLRILYGYTLLEMVGDLPAAAEQFEILSKLPGAPDYAIRLTARLKAQNRDPASALAILDDLYGNCTPDDVSWECDRIRKERIELGIEIALQQVEDAAKRFFEREHRHAEGVFELIAFGDYVGAASDAMGNTILLKEGKASTASLPRRFEVYR